MLKMNTFFYQYCIVYGLFMASNGMPNMYGHVCILSMAILIVFSYGKTH